MNDRVLRLIRTAFKHRTSMTILAGSLIIAAMTLLAFGTKPLIYDLLGQQVLAHQWLRGEMTGSVVAPTNYILKMIFIYMPLDLLSLPPQISLIGMTIAVNIVTFIAILLLLKRLLALLSIPITGIFYVAMLWLATVSGSVYWLQFTNSRNLEVAGGLLLLVLGLQFVNKPKWKLGVGYIICSSILFFADPLQIYMTGSILAAIVFIYAARKKVDWRPALLLLTLSLGGLVISMATTYLAKMLLSVEFFQVGTIAQTFYTLSHPVDAAMHAVKATGRLFAGAPSLGKYLRITNLLALVGAVGAVVMMLIRRKLPERAVIFLVVSLPLVEVVYICSGQALGGGDTSRYLIMMAPLVVVLISQFAFMASKYRKLATFALLGLVGVSTIVTAISLSKVLPISFANESHLSAAATYLQNHKMTYGYASMDTAIPASYLHPTTGTLLPLSCGSDGLAKANLFFDKGSFTKAEAQKQAMVPIILDGVAISNVPFACSEASIVTRLGFPIAHDTTADGSVVLLYADSKHLFELLPASF